MTTLPGTPERERWKVHRNNYNAVRKGKYREEVLRIKTEAGCKDCGNQHPAVLQFHHRDGTDKKDVVGQLISTHKTWKQIQEEIDKCDVLCANCHAIRHYAPGIASVKRG